MTDPDERIINRAIACLDANTIAETEIEALQDIREEARAALHRLFRDRRRLETELEEAKRLGDKTKERHVTVVPKFVTRVVDRAKKRELVGWGFEVRDGRGTLIAWNTILYKTQDQAVAAAHERFGDQVPPPHEHDFRMFLGLPVAYGIAWVREDYVSGATELNVSHKYACDKCGEQGYEIKEEVS